MNFEVIMNVQLNSESLKEQAGLSATGTANSGAVSD
jgi:hypothetical protein